MIEAEFVEIIQKIAEERGKDIFLDPTKLKAFLSDYARNEYKKERDLFLTILGSGSAEFINRAENIAECKQFLVKRLEDEHSLSTTKSAEMLDVLFLVLRGEAKEVALEPYNRGIKELDNKDYDNAIIEFTEALRLNPNDAYAFYYRGHAYRAKGQFDEAIKDYTQAIRLDPNFNFAYLNRGAVYLVKKLRDEAIRDFNEAIRIDPDDNFAHGLRERAISMNA